MGKLEFSDIKSVDKFSVSTKRFQIPSDSITMGIFGNLKLTAEKLVKEQASVKTDLDMANLKLKKSIDCIHGLLEKLQSAINEKYKFQVKQKEDSKLWKGLESKFSSTKAFLCDQLTETLQQLANLVRHAEQDKKLFEDKISASGDAFDSLQLHFSSLAMKLKSAEENLRTSEKQIAELQTEEEKEKAYVNEHNKISKLIEEKDSLIRGLDGDIATEKLQLENLNSAPDRLPNESYTEEDICRQLRVTLGILEKEKHALQTCKVERMSQRSNVSKKMFGISEASRHCNYAACRFTCFTDLPMDLRITVLTKCLQTDPERVVGHFCLVSKNWNRLVRSKDFANQYDHKNCPKGRRRIVIQTHLRGGGDSKMWDLILEEGRATILIEKCALPVGRKMIGANGVYVAFGDTSGQTLLLVQDWVAWDLHPVGMTRGPSRSLSYGFDRIFRLFRVGDAVFFEWKIASEYEDGAWSPAILVRRQIRIVGSPCSTTEYFCILLTPDKDIPIMIRICRMSGQLFEDDTPQCAQLCALHVIERRDKIHLCRLTNMDGLETFIWNNEDRTWSLFSRYDMVIGGNPQVNWRVFGTCKDMVLISCCNIIYIIDVVTGTLVHTRMLPVYGNSLVIADYIVGCRCSSLKAFARKCRTLPPV